MTLMSSISSYWTGRQLDRAGWSPRTLSFILGALFCIPGLLWLVIESRWKEAPAEGEVAVAPDAKEEVLEGRVG